MTDQAPEHFADPQRERLAHPTELQHRRPGANFTGWSRILIRISAVLALAAALVIVLLILTQISALP